MQDTQWAPRGNNVRDAEQRSVLVHFLVPRNICPFQCLGPCTPAVNLTACYHTQRFALQHSFNLLDDDDDISSDDSVESEVPQENAVPADIGTRQATVFSTGPVEVLVLPRCVLLW